MTNETINSHTAPAAIGTYSQAIRTDAAYTVYLSGQIPLDPETMTVISDEFAAQAHQVFKNLAAVAAAAGGSLADCVKLNVYLTDLNDFGVLNEVMAQYCSEPYPARAAIGVASLPRGVRIEIDGIMALE